MLADPAVASTAMAIGGGGNALNNGRMYITLKPRDERDVSAQQIIARLRPQFDKLVGARVFMQAAQDVRLGGRATRTQFEYTLQDANLDELNSWAPKILQKLKTLPDAARCRHRSADRGHHADPDDRPRHRIALRHPAATDRRHAVGRVRPAAGRAVFHADQQLSCHPGNPAGAAGQGRQPEQASTSSRR